MTNDAQVIQAQIVDGVMVVCFNNLAAVQREHRFQQVEQELWALVDQQQSVPMILDFENKELLTSHVVQHLLIRLHMRLGTSFQLCNLPPLAVWHFKINKLAKRLNIRPTREDALAAVRS